jgi:hypothetical protein
LRLEELIVETVSQSEKKMNHQEEQAMEMEALSAIFGDQFQQISDSKFSVTLVPNAEVTHVSCSSEWSFPKTYPEVPPELTLTNEKGLSEAWNKELYDKLLNAATDLVGGPMIFSLVEMGKEWLTERNVAGVGEGSMYSKMLAKEHEKQREVEQNSIAKAQQEKREPQSKKKTQEVGTLVTADTFAKWLASYMKEQAVKVKDESLKPTGRQMFEKGNLKMQEDENVAGDVEDFDRDLLLEEDIDPDDLLDDDDDDDDDEDDEEGDEE